VGIRMDVFDVFVMSLSSNWLMRSIASAVPTSSLYHGSVVHPVWW
jgi:hypothetical protein